MDISNRDLERLSKVRQLKEVPCGAGIDWKSGLSCLETYILSLGCDACHTLDLHWGMCRCPDLNTFPTCWWSFQLLCHNAHLSVCLAVFYKDLLCANCEQIWEKRSNNLSSKYVHLLELSNCHMHVEAHKSTNTCMYHANNAYPGTGKNLGGFYRKGNIWIEPW